MAYLTPPFRITVPQDVYVPRPTRRPTSPSRPTRYSPAAAPLPTPPWFTRLKLTGMMAIARYMPAHVLAPKPRLGAWKLSEY